MEPISKTHGRTCAIFSVAAFLTLGFLFYHPVFLAIVLAQLGHVATDHFHNRMAP